MTAINDDARAFGDALVEELRAEMARKGIHSVRALSAQMGITNHSYLNDRFNKGKDGKRVAFTVEDVRRIARILDADPARIIARANEARSRRPPSAEGRATG